MEKLNIAELLEDCPKGMELYSPLCGKCVFDRVNFGTIICKKQNTQEITFTSKGYYMLPVFDDCECMIFPSKDQRDWSKFEVTKPKFDITTLKPFDKVLVRHNKDNQWCGSFFSHIDDDFHSHCYKYVTITGKSYPRCIPYEGNEHLLGTTNDCDEYFKNW